MIELIFVIVILGILSAVALPKLGGVSNQAKAQRCNAAVGTMNRTVGPALWSRSMSEDNNGSITMYASEVESVYMEWPEYCGGTGTIESVVAGTDATVTIDGVDYNLSMIDGNGSISPRFGWAEQ